MMAKISESDVPLMSSSFFSGLKTHVRVSAFAVQLPKTRRAAVKTAVKALHFTFFPPFNYFFLL